ncbi:DNA polymerase epsilon subunit 3 [Nephila pilipes]|uniref:DNA polymerase epsilon subunit 3 n=1 Tax=Nephila pilipes TaxID=299642 RepID=A0A8X6NRD6_NEPPI|nr:DNA polymerase epsilon subunit 3 [Nephila pilipes]
MKATALDLLTFSRVISLPLNAIVSNCCSCVPDISIGVKVSVATMSDKIEELSLPSAVITRILKDAIPDGINISKEARSAVARAASIFVLYTTACSSQVQATSQRKTLTIADVYSALEDMLFQDMIDPIKECLEAYHADKSKKENASLSPSKSNTVAKPKRKRSNSSINKDSETINMFNNIESSIPDLQIDELESRNSVDAVL